MTIPILRNKFQKIIDVKKKNEYMRKMKNKQLEKLRDERLRDGNRTQGHDRDMSERNKYLIQRFKDQNNMLMQKKKVLELEMAQRQEIKRLKKENQLYNFQREQAIKNDYKRQLIDRLKMKAEKANYRTKTAATYNNICRG